MEAYSGIMTVAPMLIPVPGGYIAGSFLKKLVGPKVAQSIANIASRDVVAAVGPTAVSGVRANKVAGDAFRDHVASRLESKEGFRVVGVEVSVKTPLGRRQIDILAERNGGLVAFETKLGGSRYLPKQRAKDWYIARGGVDIYGTGTRTPFQTVVIRGPLS